MITCSEHHKSSMIISPYTYGMMVALVKSRNQNLSIESSTVLKYYKLPISSNKIKRPTII